VIGATVITIPSSTLELGFADQILVLENGRVVQEGTPGEVYRHPISEAAAVATGEVNIIPIHVRGNTVDSAIGTWVVARPPFQGSGIALARPHDFEIAPAGAESDLIFGVEEASFRGDRWQARGSDPCQCRVPGAAHSGGRARCRPSLRQPAFPLVWRAVARCADRRRTSRYDSVA